MNCLPTVGVHLDPSAPCERITRVAAALAVSLRAHLLGLAAPACSPSRVEPEGGSAPHAATPVVQAFERCAQACGVRSSTCRIDDRAAEHALVDLARCSDLIVLEQDESDNGLSSGLVRRVLMQGGCPVLVAPRREGRAGIGKRVMLAWDGSREASRAIRDALPLLSRAEQVHVVALDEEDGLQISRRQLNDLRTWLRRHRIETQLHWAPARWDIGDELLERAARLEADLIVMGGYGHMPAVEALFGGVTRKVLSRALLPILLSH